MKVIPQEMLVTRHAQARLQQRGVPRRVLDLVINYGDVAVHAGEGCENISLSREAAISLVEEGFNSDDVRRASGLAALIGREGIATVLRPKRGRRGRGYRRQLPTRSVKARRA
jgi:hypothetical protein